MQKTVLRLALEKAKLKETDLDAAFVGDLLNQCIGSSFSMRNNDVPTFGLYGACSTMAESLLLAGISVSGGFCRKALTRPPRTSPLPSASIASRSATAGNARRRRSGR